MSSGALYDAFAWFYDLYWNEEFHALAFPILERVLLPRVRRGARILDVCCGTGYLAALLLERGFRVTGVDASPEMIRFANKRAPGARFHVAAADEYETAAPFDAAVSTFDSLNHITDYDRLARAFARTAGALKPGAPFVFDTLLEEAYQTHWGEAYALVRDDHVLTITGGGYDARTRLACCDVTMFRLIDGQWQRADMHVTERSYTVDEIEDALARAGFEGIASYDARDLGMGGNLGAGRTFIAATKTA